MPPSTGRGMLIVFLPAIRGSTSQYRPIQACSTDTVTNGRSTRHVTSRAVERHECSHRKDSMSVQSLLWNESYLRTDAIPTVGILELVRPHGMVPTRACRRWHNLPRTHGHERCHLQRPPRSTSPRRHPKRLCHACSWVQCPDCIRDLPVSRLDSTLAPCPYSRN